MRTRGETAERGMAGRNHYHFAWRLQQRREVEKETHEAPEEASKKGMGSYCCTRASRRWAVATRTATVEACSEAMSSSSMQYWMDGAELGM